MKVLSTNEQRFRMGCMCGFSPYDALDWPFYIIDRFISIETRDGKQALHEEMYRMFSAPAPTIADVYKVARDTQRKLETALTK